VQNLKSCWKIEIFELVDTVTIKFTLAFSIISSFDRLNMMMTPREGKCFLQMTFGQS
jgi:hypothetical protein